MHDKVAHTAEHAFVGSLQRRIGQVLSVRKVEHKADTNTAFIAIPRLELQTVLDAQEEVNDLIRQGRKVTERTFESLGEAKKALPGLRANEERISGQARVVEIENHDVAACAMEHAQDLSECDYFLVTRLSKSGNEYEVDFVVGMQAKRMALSISARLLRVCSELGANVSTVENTARKLMVDRETFRNKLRSLGCSSLSAINPVQVGRFSLLTGTFSDLDDDQLAEFAGERIAKAENVAVLIANRGQETARLVFARSESMRELDCNSLFKKIVGSAGRGGGKTHFATGAVKNDELIRIMNEISREIAKLS